MGRERNREGASGSLPYFLAVEGGLGVQLHGDLFAVLLRFDAGFAAGCGGVAVPGGGTADFAAKGSINPSLDLDVVRCSEALLGNDQGIKMFRSAVSALATR